MRLSVLIATGQFNRISADLVLVLHAVSAGEAFGLEALEDHQLGGLIIWMPGGQAYLLVGLAPSQWLARPARVGVPGALRSGP